MDETVKIYQLLKNDSDFITKMGGATTTFKRIYNNPKAPNDDEFPRATIIETLCEDSDFFDNVAEYYRCVVRIDFFSKQNNLKQAMDRAKKLIDNAFDMVSVSYGADMYENDTQVYHKQLDITLKIESEE